MRARLRFVNTCAVSSNTNGAAVSYSYDDLNRLSTVVDNRLSGNNTTNYSYDPASNLATATYPTACSPRLLTTHSTG